MTNVLRNHIDNRNGDNAFDKEAGWLSITEAALLLRITTKTLRRWERCGIVTSKRNHLNHRRYNHQELLVLNRKKHDLLPTTPHTPAPTEYYTISEAATKMNCSIKTLRRWEKLGKIHAVRNEQSQRLFMKNEIDTLVREQARIAKNRLLHSLPYSSSFSGWYSLPIITILIYLPFSIVTGVIQLSDLNIIHPSSSPLQSNNSLQFTPNDYSDPTTNHIANHQNLIHIYNDNPIPYSNTESPTQNELYHLPTIIINDNTFKYSSPNQLPESLPITGEITNIDSTDMLK
jgi:DNA-binding transcriptional MerR regulator